MAKDVEIKFRVKTEGGEEIEKVAKSLDDLAEAQKQTQQALGKVDVKSEEYKKLSGELKTIDKAMGAAKTSTMSLGEKLGSVGGPIGGVIQGFQGMGKAATAFIANPIGAVIAALGVIFAAVTKAIKNSEEAMDAVTKITAIFGGIVRPVFEFLETVAVAALDAVASGLEAVASLFGDAGKAAGDYADALDNAEDSEKDLAVTRAQTNKQLAESREILSDTNATYEQRVAALKKVQAVEGAQSAQEVANRKELLRLANENIKINGRSEEAVQKLRDAQIALANVEQDAAAKQRQFNKQQKALDSEKEAAAKEAAAKAKAAADKAAADAKTRNDAALASLKEGLKKAKDEKDAAYLLSIKDDAERAREALRIQQENQDADIQAKIKAYTDKKKLTSTEEKALQALRDSAAAQDLRQAAETIKLKEDQDKAAADKKKADEAKAFADKNAALDEQYKQETLKLLQQGLTAEQLRASQDQLELAAIQRKIDAAKAAGQSSIDLEIQLATKKKEILDADVKATEDAAKKKAEIQMQQFNGIMTAASSVVNAVAAVQEAQQARELKSAGDNLQKQEEIKKKYFEKGKKTQIANAIIGTIQGAVQAFTSLASIPVVGPALGAVAAAAALVAGYANVAKIKATEYEGAGDAGGGGGGGGGAPTQAPSMFAGGGIVTGPGTGVSDSIPARLSNGESVINARSTSMYSGLLSLINEAGGGKSFADGGVAGQTPPQTPIIKTYVVASEVSSQQEADFRIQQVARL
jgi:hypothetical protein